MNEDTLKRGQRTKIARWLWLLLVIPLVLGLLRLRFDVDVLNLLPEELPAVQGLKLYQQHFARAHELIVSVNAPDAETAADAARSLASHLREQRDFIRDAVWQPPWLDSPAESAELIAYLWLNQPPGIFSELTNRFTSTNLIATLNATRERLATTLSPDEMARLPYDPLGLMRLPADRSAPTDVGGYTQDDEMFASADGTFRIMFVQATSDLKNYREAGAWLDRLRAGIAAWQSANPHFAATAIKLTGAPAFTTEIARGMEKDTTKSVLGTLGVIAVLFWWAHRKFRPLLWLICMMVLILVSTVALAGLLVGTLNVVSIGFAAILLGLAVDYGLVLYQEWRANPESNTDQIRRAVGPSIVWSAVSTAGAFALLNFGGLPGLGQLGTMVALGTALAAIVMMYGFLPQAVGGGEISSSKFQISNREGQHSRWRVWIVSGAFCIAAIATLATGFPRLDSSAEPLRPRKSDAYNAMDEIQTRIGSPDPRSWIIFRASKEGEIEQNMRKAEQVLGKAVANKTIDGFQLPLALLPNAANQAVNRSVALWLAAQEPNVRAESLASGFSTNSLTMTEAILRAWKQAALTSVTFSPTNRASRWLTEKIFSREHGEYLAAGIIYQNKAAGSADTDALSQELHTAGALVAGWDALGRGLIGIVTGRLGKLVVPMVAVLIVSLCLAFGSWVEVALALSSLAAAFLALLTIMRWAGWSWNLMNLMAVPLLFGTGIDYSIHIQSGLRRHAGNLANTRRTIGRALLLCGGTTIAGFGSLVWSSNAGLASLGLVCATGIACSLVVAVALLPHAWLAFCGKDCAGQADSDLDQCGLTSAAAGPSSLYRASLWRLGLIAVRLLPLPACLAIARALARLYSTLVPARRSVVIENVSVPVSGDLAKARQITRRLFDNFAVKLVDLWRFENNERVDSLLVSESGWKQFEATRVGGRGVLVVTPHLGNWEFGGPLLVERNIKLHVVTLLEPGSGFTELRRDGRASRGISTVIIGHNPFSFIEVIKLLEAGEVVAMLIDRPPPSSAVTVELFGRPFQASVAAAELARASGCAILPVYLPRVAGGYAAHILPEIDYDRAALNKREARAELTKRVLRAFEPVIRQHLDQWYHFVPLWRRENWK